MIPSDGEAGLEWATEDLLARRAATTPDRTALIDADTGRQWRYCDLDEDVDDVADRLPGEAGDRLGVLVDTGPGFVTLLFGAMRADRTLVLLNLEETPDELASKAARAGVTALVCGDETTALARRVVTAFESASADRTDPPATPPVYALEDSLRPIDDRDVPTVPESRARPEESALLIAFTSGTTGEPKGVRLTASNLVSSAIASAFRLGVDPDDRWLCCLPMYHVGGLAPVFRSTLYGTAVVLQRTFEAAATATVVAEYDVTGVSLVPTMVTRLLKDGWDPPSSLRFVLLGGAPASAELIDRCERHQVPVCPTYGMTETASQIATARPATAFAHEGTVGQPLLPTRVTVVDDDGAPVGAGEVGELVVDGPTVTPGYLEADRTAEAMGQYGLHTGDVGHRDEDGRLWIHDRKTDRIVTGGENVDPAEVAAVLESHPAVAEAAVVGVPDAEWGERVGALVREVGNEPESGRSSATESERGSEPTLDPATVRSYARGRLAGFKCPKTIAVVADIPRTHSGTVDREAAVERLRQRGVDVSGSPS